jgi:hypothetical protein
MKIDHVKNLGQALIAASTPKYHIAIDPAFDAFTFPIRIVTGRVNKNGDMFVYDINAVNTYVEKNVKIEERSFDRWLEVIRKTVKKHGVIKK